MGLSGFENRTFNRTGGVENHRTTPSVYPRLSPRAAMVGIQETIPTASRFRRREAYGTIQYLVRIQLSLVHVQCGGDVRRSDAQLRPANGGTAVRGKNRPRPTPEGMHLGIELSVVPIGVALRSAKESRHHPCDAWEGCQSLGKLVTSSRRACKENSTDRTRA